MEVNPVRIETPRPLFSIEPISSSSPRPFNSSIESLVLCKLNSCTLGCSESSRGCDAAKGGSIPSPIQPPLAALQPRDFDAAESCKNLVYRAQEGLPRNRIFLYISRAFHFIKRKLITFFRWVGTLFSRENKTIYFKIPTSNNGEGFIYRKRESDFEMRIGPKNVFLINVKEKDLIHMTEMIHQFMEDEKIDGIQTNRFSIAYHLWKSGLKTQGVLPFQLNGPDMLNCFVKMVLQTAMLNKNALSVTAQTALMRIESRMIQVIVGEQDAYEGHELQTDELEDVFDPELCRARIDDVENQLDYSFDLPAHVQKAEAEENVRYAEILNQIPLEKGEPEEGENSFELLLEDLFILIEATKTIVDQTLIQHLPIQTFTKRK